MRYTLHMGKKLHKTNAMRLLGTAGIAAASVKALSKDHDPDTIRQEN